MRLDDLVQQVSAVGHDVRAGTLSRGWGPFAACSERFLTELVARLEDGRFHDPIWVRELLIEADVLYLAAVRNVAARTPAWQVGAAAIEREHKPVMRNLLLGIVCHIAYDLVVTLATRITPANVDAAVAQRQREDFQRINDIIAGSIDGVQNEIREGTEEWVTYADIGFSRLDELATWAMFKYTRARAFDDAERVYAGTLTIDDVAARSVKLVRLLAIVPL